MEIVLEIEGYEAQILRDAKEKIASGEKLDVGTLATIGEIVIAKI